MQEYDNNTLAMINIQTQLANLDNKIDVYYSNIIQKLETLLLLQSSVSSQIALSSAGMTLRASRLKQEYVFVDPKIDLKRVIKIDDQLRMLQVQNPALFAKWFELFENGRKAYEITKDGNISHHGNIYARLFGFYLEVYTKGAILDIGIGPYGVPSYLKHYPQSAISGLEPLAQFVRPGVDIYRGLNEFLPWCDNQFDTVISATSLDHVFSLEKSLEEVRRVMKPNGTYLVWLASIPGSPKFDESQENFIAIDQFHLFHFERYWIEPIFEKHFDIVDITIVPQIGFDHIFYCLKKSI